MELENFGVDLDAINDTPTCLKRIFCYWIKKWEETLLKDNKDIANLRLLRKYSGLVFTDDVEPFETVVISQDKMQLKPFKGDRWCVVGEPTKYNGRNDCVLWPFLINKERIYSLL